MIQSPREEYQNGKASEQYEQNEEMKCHMQWNITHALTEIRNGYHYLFDCEIFIIKNTVSYKVDVIDKETKEISALNEGNSVAVLTPKRTKREMVIEDEKRVK